MLSEEDLLGNANTYKGESKREWQHNKKFYCPAQGRDVPNFKAIAAPAIPMFNGNTNNQSPTIFTAPPIKVENITYLGEPSLLMNAPKNAVITKDGRPAKIHAPYSFA